MSFVAVGFNPLNHSRTEFIVYSGFHHFICEERVATARDGGHAPGTDRLVERENMYSMVVTQDTSQSPIGWLKEQWVSHVIASNEDTPLELSDQKARAKFEQQAHLRMPMMIHFALAKPCSASPPCVHLVKQVLRQLSAHDAGKHWVSHVCASNEQTPLEISDPTFVTADTSQSPIGWLNPMR